MTTTTDERVLLEPLADRLLTPGGERDHGIAWTGKNERDLLKELADEHELDLWELAEGSDLLFESYYEPAGGMITSTTRLHAVTLPSGRTLFISYEENFYGWQLLGAGEEGKPLAAQRAAQAMLAGETGEMGLNALPTSFGTACPGIVAVDAVHHGLERFDYARNNLHGEDEFCCGDYEILGVGEERHDALITAIEEQINDDDDPDGTLAQLLDDVSFTPIWLYALDDEHWETILALGKDVPALPLHGTPPAQWTRLEPHQVANDPWYLAAALLALYHQL
jgi:hypothetical protein